MADSHQVTVRYFAAARSAAGVTEESVTVPADATVAVLLKSVADRHGAELTRVLRRCSYLLDEVAVRDRDRRLSPGAVIDVLPPFAGG